MYTSQARIKQADRWVNLGILIWRQIDTMAKTTLHFRDPDDAIIDVLSHFVNDPGQ
jgi:hypothetical protein